VENGWQSSAHAWIADMGERGDFGRRYVLDPVMLPRAVAGSPKNALDVGCGEGRFCRMLKSHSGGRRLYYPIDNYLQEHAMWIEYRGIRVLNHHRPLSTYLRALLAAGLVLTHFDEPAPTPDAPASRANGYARAPWFLVMQWLKPPQECQR
jgi:hypothetical protein